MSDEKVIQSFVVGPSSKEFFVSTIERNSSAAATPNLRFNETIVWEWSKAGIGEMLHQDEDFKGSIRVHQVIVESLHKTGQITPERSGSR